MGPITRALQAAYQDAIHGRHPRSPEWLTYAQTAVPVNVTAAA
jgi:hypothetical protein